MKEVRFDIVVVGAGAAGMMAAIKASEAGANVAVIERNPLCGRKVMITGKGRCNITNMKPWSEFSSHLHPKASFAKNAFFNFSNEDTVSYFNEIGLPTVVTQGQRVFPESMKASSVVDALVVRMASLNVRLYQNCTLVSLRKCDGGYECLYNRNSVSDLECMMAQAVIVATGGLSYPHTGSTGKGYEVASGFGHTIKERFPSLTALIPKNFDTRLVGLNLENVGVCLTVDGSIVQIETGDLSFTEGGIEGSLGFRISRKAVHAIINGGHVEVILDMKPGLSLNALKARIKRELDEAGWTEKEMSNRQFVALMKKLVPQQMILPFIDAHKKLNINNLADILKGWRFPIAKYVGYERAVVTAGGVSTDEVVSKTMQSRLSKGLFFAGEVLDVDGDTGGYNLQFAFSSGALAGQNAAKYVRSVAEARES